jgi:hypothetical protein
MWVVGSGWWVVIGNLHSHFALGKKKGGPVAPHFLSGVFDQLSGALIN